MSERVALAFGYLCIAVTMLGIAGIFALGATGVTVGVFVAGFAGVVLATAALVSVEQGARGPASRTG